MVHQSLQADVFLEGDAVATLQSLIAVLRKKGVDDAVAARRERWVAGHEAWWPIKGARRRRTGRPLSRPSDCARLWETCCPTMRSMSTRPLPSTRLSSGILTSKGPQSFYTAATSGLRQGLGLALGTKLARRDRLVVSVIGDGSFMYNPVTQSLALSKHKNLPILIVVFNNEGYSAMRKEHHTYYPDGIAAEHSASVGHTITSLTMPNLARHSASRSPGGKAGGFTGRDPRGAGSGRRRVYRDSQRLVGRRSHGTLRPAQFDGFGPGGNRISWHGQRRSAKYVPAYGRGPTPIPTESWLRLLKRRLK